MPIASAFLDGVGEPASAYRKRIYEKGFSGTYTSVSLADVRSFAQTATAFMEHSIDANKRTGRIVPCLQPNDGD